MTEKILVVDDEERIRKLLNLYLTREGMKLRKPVTAKPHLSWQ